MEVETAQDEIGTNKEGFDTPSLRGKNSPSSPPDVICQLKATLASLLPPPRLQPLKSTLNVSLCSLTLYFRRNARADGNKGNKNGDLSQTPEHFHSLKLSDLGPKFSFLFKKRISFGKSC